MKLKVQRKKLLQVILMLQIVVLATYNSTAQSKLFVEGGESIQSLRKAGPNILQSRITEISDIKSIDFNLFPDANFTGVLKNPNNRNESLKTGSIKGIPDSLFTLVKSGNRIFAAVHAGGREFSIDPLPDGKYKIDELDSSEPLRCGTVLADIDTKKVLNNLPTEAQVQAPLQVADGREITVLVVYSNGVAADNTSDYLSGIVKRAIEDTNGIMHNSQIDLTIRLVGLEHISFDETNLSNDLTRIARDSATARLRNEKSADQVTLITRFDRAYWGIGYVLQDFSQPRGPLAYSVVAEEHFHNGYVFAHELGHSLGCQHDRANSYNTSGIFMPGLFGFSNGHYYTPSDGIKYGTIMSYIGTRIPFYSNPDVFYPPGQSNNATGDVTLNNAETIRRSKQFVANYR